MTRSCTFPQTKMLPILVKNKSVKVLRRQVSFSIWTFFSLQTIILVDFLLPDKIVGGNVFEFQTSASQWQNVFYRQIAKNPYQNFRWQITQLDHGLSKVLLAWMILTFKQTWTWFWREFSKCNENYLDIVNLWNSQILIQISKIKVLFCFVIISFDPFRKYEPRNKPVGSRRMLYIKQRKVGKKYSSSITNQFSCPFNEKKI